MTDHEPNPVAEIILKRTLQVSAGTLLGLNLLRGFGGAKAVRRVLPAATVLTVGGLSAYFLRTFHPHTKYPGTVLLRRLPADSGPPGIALTFDDGPFPESTAHLLDILAAQDAKATFFVVAERAAANPGLMRRIAAEGHAVGIHGLRHRTMALLSRREVLAELKTARALVEEALGAALPSLLFRPPYGFRSATLARAATEAGWTTVGWSFDPRDYEPGVNRPLLLRRFRNCVAPGDIVLLHERPASEPSATREAVSHLLRWCRFQGWQCLPL